MNISNRLSEDDPLLAESPPEYESNEYQNRNQYRNRNRNRNIRYCEVSLNKRCIYGGLCLYIIVSIFYVICAFYYITHSNDYNETINTTSTHSTSYSNFM